MSGRLPALTPQAVLRALQRGGFFVHHVRGSHHYLKHPKKPGMLVVIPFHGRELKRWLLHSILRQAGLTIEAFQEFL
jgi:predicted RNA binding protein YcfA (HicA-like mRNA interferase family)